jgi:hypothetical protein
MTTPAAQVSDRRLSPRYPVDLPLEFRVIPDSIAPLCEMPATGFGRVINLSDCGMLFESATPVPPGLKLQFAIEWPSRRPAIDVKLRGAGITVRSGGRSTALAFQEYEFDYGFRAGPAA